MGETSLSRQEVEALVVKLGQQYRGNKYHLLQRNCNHFTSDLCAALVGRAAPGWINRLAGVAVALHCLIPPSWVPPLDTPSASPDKAGGPETGVFSPPRAPGPARVAAVTTQRSSRAAGGCSSADASPRAGLGSDNMREALIDATTSSRSDVMVVSTSTYTSPQRSVASHLPPESGVGVVSPTSVRVTMAGSSGGGGGASSQDGGRSAVVSPSRSGITSPTSRA